MSCNKSQSALEVLPLFPSLCIYCACVLVCLCERVYNFSLVAVILNTQTFQWIIAGVYVQFANTLFSFGFSLCSIHMNAKCVSPDFSACIEPDFLIFVWCMLWCESPVCYYSLYRDDVCVRACWCRVVSTQSISYLRVFFLLFPFLRYFFAIWNPTHTINR